MPDIWWYPAARWAPTRGTLGRGQSHGRNERRAGRTHRRRIRWRTEPYRSERQPEPVRADRKPFGRFDFRTVPRNRAGGKTVPAAQPSDRGIVIHSDRGAGTCAFRRAQHRSWANELNRNLFAVPGDITMPHNTGCNRLIQDGRAPSSAHWRRSTNYAIARIARNMSTCRMTPNIRRNRQMNPTMPYSPPLRLAPKQTATSPPTICSI